MLGMSAAAQYAERAAEVSPVLAQPTAEMVLAFIFLILFTWLTKTVIPRSLKLPVWEFPHCLTHKSVIPSIWPYLSAQNRLEFPSYMLTTSSLLIPGRIHSFLLHTPDP